jgi:hypothetical protein
MSDGVVFTTSIGGVLTAEEDSEALELQKDDEELVSK